MIVKKFGLFALCLLMLFSFFPYTASAADIESMPSISAQSGVVICADSSDVVYSKNMDEKLPMASTTKIMTSLICLSQPDCKTRIVTITPEMVAVEGSSMGLKADDKITLYGLAQGMLLVSGNDAANSVAIAIAGSTNAFADMMNDKASQLGMKNTHFVTPSGLDDDEHYSTAYDMALLASAALENDDFREITQSKSMNVDFANPKKTVKYHNENKMVFLYDGCIGVKTGFTKKSGRCLVSAAERDGIRLVAVTLNDPNDWDDHTKMLDYGFSNTHTICVDDTDKSIDVPVVGSKCDSLKVCPMFDTCISLSNSTSDTLEKKIILPPFLYAPIKKGDIVGEIQYLSNGKVVSSVDLIAEDDIEYKEGGFINYIKGLFDFG